MNTDVKRPIVPTIDNTSTSVKEIHSHVEIDLSKQEYRNMTCMHTFPHFLLKPTTPWARNPGTKHI